MLEGWWPVTIQIATSPHFKCVGLVRQPQGEWYCSDTCKGQTIS